MEKGIRNMIIWIAAAVVLVISLIVLINLPQEEAGSEAQSSGISALTFNDYAANDISSVKVKNQYDEYTVNTQDGICSISQLDKLPTSTTKFSALIADCSGVAATQIIDEDAADLSIFGLINPKSVIEICYTDDETLNLYVGNDAPSSSGVYVCEAGQSKVYLFSSAKVDTFFYSTNDFINEYITDALASDSTAPNLIKMTLEGISRSKPITIESNSSHTSYNVASEVTHQADNTVVTNYANQLIGLKSTGVIKYNVTQTDLERYGLAKPYSKITAEYNDRSFTLLTSTIDNNSIYVMREGVPVIYKITSDIKDVFKAQYNDIALKTIITSELNALKTLTITIDNTKYQFNVSYDESNNVKNISYNGNLIDYSEFNTFYNNIKAMRNQEFGSESKSTDKSLIICEFAYSDTAKSNDVITFYPSSNSEKASIDINGNCNSIEYMTYVNKLINDCKSVTSGQKIQNISSMVSSIVSSSVSSKSSYLN